MAHLLFAYLQRVLMHNSDSGDTSTETTMMTATNDEKQDI